MRRLIRIFYLCLVSLTPALSDAQSPDSLTYILRDVQVTATGAPKTAVSTAPTRIVDQQQMLRSGVTDVSDALHRMPGVTLRDYGGAGGLKTVSVRGFGAGHTGVFYDGVPLTDVQSGQIDLSRYSVDNVKDISMVIGDNDDIFIPARLAASAATVSITTLPSIDQKELNAKMRFGSFGYYNPFLRVGTPIGENAAINFVGEYTHADNDYPFKLTNGDITTTEKRNNSRMNSLHGETNLLYNIGESSTLTAKVYYYNNARRLPGPVIYYNNVNHERLHEYDLMSQVQIRSSLADGLSLKAILKYDLSSSKYHDENGKYPGGVLDQNYWQREYYAAAALLYVPTSKLLLDYSADYFYNNLNSNLRTDSRPYRNSILQSLTAKYKTQRITITGRLLYSIYDNGAKKSTAARDAQKLSPSVSMSWQPFGTQLMYLRASYKNIFRMPTFNEAYFDHYGSKDIRPESTDQINVGATYTLRGISWLPEATFTVDGYINHIKDMIVAVPYNMFIWNMVNLGKVKTVGLDITALATASVSKDQDISLSLSYSYQRAMPRTDPKGSDWNKQVAYIPKHSGSTSVSYENPWVNVSVYATGVSERYTTNNNLPATRIKGYVEAGSTLWHTFGLHGHKLDVRADIQNIFNKQYYIVARYPMPGRQYKLTVAYSF